MKNHKNKNSVTIAAMGDIHIRDEESKSTLRNIMFEVSEKADYLVICGDLTQRGSFDEIELFVQDLDQFHIPIITVLGNHDYESGKHEEIVKYLKNNKIYVLEGNEPIVINSVGFAGVKGFCGGYEDYMLQLWGEEVIKQFYYEGVNEARRLEDALAKLRTEKKVVLLHYSPVRETVVGESPEIFTYLGSSRLEDPINRFHASVVFHGHAHHGTHKGKTATGIPVYNVSFPLMEHLNPKHPYLLVEI